MRKIEYLAWMSKQSTGTLKQIVVDCGFCGCDKFDRSSAYTFLILYAKTHKLTVGDFKARYENDARVHLVA